jgi:hypothetical protein
MRYRMQEIDRVYQREQDYTTKQRAYRAMNAQGDPTKIQNPVVPIVMPQVETAITDLVELFGLASYPLFPMFSKPEMMDEALQMETVIGEQGVKFGWAAELMAAMRDGLKYNLMATEVVWEDKKVYAVTNDAVNSLKEGTPQETIYSGNAVKRLNPYNMILDMRVPPYRIHDRGEFAGYIEIIGRMELKQRIAEMDPTKTMNAKKAFESGNGTMASSIASTDKYFVPQVNPFAMIDVNNVGMGANINWHAWAGLEDKEGGIQYADMYEVVTLYARILPAEHKIFGNGPNTPQIWKMIIVNRSVVIYAARQNNAHNYLPIIVAQATEGGLDWQDKSFADNAAPYQQIATGLFNSAMASQRRKVYDRIFYDPTRINKSDIDKVDPVARIPVKAEAYGKPVGDAYSVAPYRDEGVPEILQIAASISDMADIANGQNRVARGQFQKGNKTREEYKGTMDNSNARPRMTALVLETRFFTPLKHILKLNTLQYQTAGEMFNRNTKEAVNVDPTKLRAAAMEFRMADGLLPTDSYVNMELFQVIGQMAAQNPMLAQGWDITGMIMYWMKLEGATWIDDFKVATAPGTQPPGTQPNANPTTPPQRTPANGATNGPPGGSSPVAGTQIQ